MHIIAQILITHCLEIQRFPAQRSDDFVFERHLRFQPISENLFVSEVAPANAVVADLVGESRADAAPRGAGRSCSLSFFVQAVQQLVIRHDDV